MPFYYSLNHLPMKQELDLSSAKLHPVTGFLEIPGNAFSSEQKGRFLRIYEDTGDKVRAMDSIGYSDKHLKAHLLVDKAFKAAYDNVEAIQLAKVEAVLYQRSLQDRGDAARNKWLAARCPEKYAVKPEPSKPGAKRTKLDDLLDLAIPIEEETDEAQD